MKTLRSLLLVAACLIPGLATTAARADGCYICSSGSSPSCKDYCRYSGSDTFATRKACQAKGCKVGGTASCPTAVNYKVCLAPTPGSDTTVAQAPMCQPPAPRS